MDISIPVYVKYTLHKFQHPTPTMPQHSPHQWTEPKYGSTATQLTHSIYNSPALNKDEASNVEEVVGTFFYYACAVDPEILVTLNTIAAEQYKITQEKGKNCCILSIMHPPTLRQSPTTTPEE